MCVVCTLRGLHPNHWFRNSPKPRRRPQEKEAVNAKILKDVKFPMLLDVYELCSEELQQKLLPMRTHFKAWEDLKAEEARVPAHKAADAAADKKEVACVPFSFEDG